MDNENSTIEDVFHVSPIHGEEYILGLRSKVKELLDRVADKLSATTEDELKSESMTPVPGVHDTVQLAALVLKGTPITGDVPHMGFMLTSDGETADYNVLVFDVAVENGDGGFRTVRFNVTPEAVASEIEPSRLFNTMAVMLGGHIHLSVDGGVDASGSSNDEPEEQGSAIHAAVFEYLSSLSDDEKQDLDTEMSKVKNVYLAEVLDALQAGENETNNGEVILQFITAEHPDDANEVEFKLWLTEAGEPKPFYILDITGALGLLPVPASDPIGPHVMAAVVGSVIESQPADLNQKIEEMLRNNYQIGLEDIPALVEAGTKTVNGLNIEITDTGDKFTLTFTDEASGERMGTLTQ